MLRSTLNGASLFLLYRLIVGNLQVNRPERPSIITQKNSYPANVPWPTQACGLRVNKLTGSIMNKQASKMGLLLLIVAMVIGIGFEYKTHFVKKAVANILYDNREHYLSCAELPTLSEVEQVVEEHQNLIREIEQVNPGFIFVSINAPCPGKGEILIEYPSHQNRLQIEELIGDKTFFGIPYRGINT